MQRLAFQMQGGDPLMDELANCTLPFGVYMHNPKIKSNVGKEF